ncbi:hypothetical protein FNV43_RR00161 [Rhamnella rubrinervis]|uniref:Uncharacterized protein n=1 Tax=Rhamnella rubrinervis TaxID=2594499 RepID=A0A8K0HN56_9ROSA|nr:hypothetical protein FNV43_RR00161 [Rhamnella rubrinervis]
MRAPVGTSLNMKNNEQSSVEAPNASSTACGEAMMAGKCGVASVGRRRWERPLVACDGAAARRDGRRWVTGRER